MLLLCEEYGILALVRRMVLSPQSLLLTQRRYVDLLRIASAVCPDVV
jgi:hypothetical protein